MSTLLLTPQLPDTTEAGDPTFANLRRHHAAASCGTVLMMGAHIALGAESARVRTLIQPKKGRPSKNSNSVAIYETTPWRDLIQTHAGLSYETARRDEKVAADLRLKLDGKRDKDSVMARKLIDDPTKIDSFEHYELLARVCGHHYDADTWHGILVEAGIVRRPVAPSPGQSGGDADRQMRLPLDEEARIAAIHVIRQFRELTAHQEKWRQRLAVLPLDPTGDPEKPSLTDLRAEFADRLQEIDETILRKKSAR